tara:strand:- start:37225 stop:37431 length:207 start_codon:yes stop_codon:yes gene_type:complete
VRAFTNKDGVRMQRSVIWNLGDWPRVRDLQESLVWVRSRLVVPDPVEEDAQAEIQVALITTQDPLQPR